MGSIDRPARRVRVILEWTWPASPIPDDALLAVTAGSVSLSAHALLSGNRAAVEGLGQVTIQSEFVPLVTEV